MRWTLIIISALLLFLGMWLIGSAFIEPPPAEPIAAEQIRAVGDQVSPAIPGVACLVGGTLLLWLVLRR